MVKSKAYRLAAARADRGKESVDVLMTQNLSTLGAMVRRLVRLRRRSLVSVNNNQLIVFFCQFGIISPPSLSKAALAQYCMATYAQHFITKHDHWAIFFISVNVCVRIKNVRQYIQ